MICVLVEFMFTIKVPYIIALRSIGLAEYL